MNFKRIDREQAQKLLAGAAQVVDIRDEQSFTRGHIETAFHLHNANLQEFMEQADIARPLLVYCYHGNMSQSAAAYFAEQGFIETYSLDGGYEAWNLMDSRSQGTPD